MKKMIWKILINSITAIIIFLSVNIQIIAQMPPHPSLLKKIKNGEMEKPYVLQHLAKLRQKGIDAQWNSPINKFLEKSRINLMNKRVNSINSLEGNYNALVIIVDFSDQPFKTNETYFDNLLFSNANGTLADYLKEITYGTLSLTTANLPSTIKVIRAPQTYKYYVNNQNGMGSYPQNSQKLVEDILGIIDPVVDFSKYDNDGDGRVDALFFVHSGQGAEWTGKSTDIWAHSWGITPQNRDGVSISNYSIEPEYWQSPGDMTFGVFAHEMGHAAFGLPDLYDTDYSSMGIGDWSLMSSGSWNGTNGNSPAHPDAWCKIKMGDFNPANITDDITGLQISNIEANPVAYRIWKNGTLGSEYFLIENRQKIGYDATLPGNGLLIYHVDENVNSNTNEWYPGNTGNGHFSVALVQADGQWDLEKNLNGGDAGDPYPGSSMNTEFSGSSIPNNKNYDGGYPNLSITNISNSSGTMFVDISLEDYLQFPVLKLDYGNVQSPAVIDTAKLEFINSGPNTVVINNISHINNDFTITNGFTYPLNISGNSNIHLDITFIPTSIGTIQDTISINYTTGKTLLKKAVLNAVAFQVNKVQENTLYGAVRKSNQGSFITINVGSGLGTMIGYPGFPDARSITISNNTKTIYGLSSSTTSSEILKIDADSGQAYSVLQLDSVLAAIAFDTSDVMYGISDGGTLYNINLSNGKCNFIGETGLNFTGLAFNPSNNELYGCIGRGIINKDGIYRLNTKNADTIFVGHTGLNNYTADITFDKDGNMYGLRNNLVSANDLIKINPYTGEGTVIGNTNFKSVRALAMYNGKPTIVTDNNFTDLPDKFELEQNYPNPFNPVTKIIYRTPENSFVTLKVFDILGKEVAVLVNKEQTKGTYTIDFNAENLSSGIYIYQLSAGRWSF